LFRYDKKAYDVLRSKLYDISQAIVSTNFLGFGLDKVFGTKSIEVVSVKVIKKRSHYMDHYPVVIEVKESP
jgi:endonuclease/exonuclease/phosphatase family metal-dependent hydrolase